MITSARLRNPLLGVAALALLGGAPRALAQEGAPTVSATQVEKWHAFVRPDKAEEHWQTLTWHPSLWSAVVAANETNRPVLLWAMNGHPLGCT